MTLKNSKWYDDIGLMVGLELHQQLETSRKLFCHCPTKIRDDAPHGAFVRRLRPSKSEMGEIDPAALFEFQKGSKFRYEYYNDSTCLVEADEEPPHDLCDEAVDICLTMANFMHSRPVDEIHPMRKIVIDGSNTTGFQRTAIVALGGHITVSGKEIGIQTIAVEEDAARKISDQKGDITRTYRLDRLGIPLIEIATAPDIRTPQEAQEVALSIGMLLRATGKVKRGLGTIRQDVNVSIKGGGIIEIKGLQQLDLLSTVVEYEVLRQVNLLRIRDELRKRGVSADTLVKEIRDVSKLFSNTESKMLRKTLSTGGAVYGLKLSGFAGLLGEEIQPGRRFGTELSDYAKFWGGVSGIIHTDELPKYGINEQNTRDLRKRFDASQMDAIVIVAAPKENCIDALEAVHRRAIEALEGVPAETRTPLPEGQTKYARPRPGAQRMYPETDVRPLRVENHRLKAIRRKMPETLDKRKARFIKEHGLSAELAEQIIRSPFLSLYENIVHNFAEIDPTLVAVTLVNTLVSVSREQGIDAENLDDHSFEDLFRAIATGQITAEAIPEILRLLLRNKEMRVLEVVQSLGLDETISDDELESIIQKAVAERVSYIHEQGEKAIGGIMGVVMGQVRGRASGRRVKELVSRYVGDILASN